MRRAGSCPQYPGFGPTAGGAGLFVRQWRLDFLGDMDILFVADPLEVFKTYKDTTFSMMREAQRRGHRVFACEPRHLVWESGGLVSAAVRDIRLTGDENDWFEVAATRTAALKDFGAVLMRKDPPF